MARHRGAAGFIKIGAVELADAVVGETGPGADGVGAGLVVDEAQREVEPQPVPAIAIV